MHSFTVWKQADRPNYNVNIDLEFPYSGLPHQGEYELVKIPASLNDLIQHVDYWGEGRVVSGKGISGFPNCYNINHQYRLVSTGADKDKKIPNRIPVLSYTNCDTSDYIKDNSVITVTVAGTNITTSCVQDIARIVNNDLGKVIVYGVQTDSQEITELAAELRKKGLFPCQDVTLPSELQGLTYFKSHVAFLNNDNIRALKDDLYNNIVNGKYDDAVNISRTIETANVGEVIDEVVKKLIKFAPKTVMTFAYKLWHAGAKQIVSDHFPNPIFYIINKDAVTIVNKQYGQALKLEKIDKCHDSRIWGDDKALALTSERLSWKFLPACDSDDGLLFHMYNTDRDKYMRTDDSVDYVGDRQCFGSTRNEENLDNDRYKYYLEPVIKDNELMFIIVNRQHKQGLKLEVKQDAYGDRLLWGHNGNIHEENDRFRWIIKAWSKSRC